MTTLKTAWRTVRKKAGVTGRWDDNRHPLITDLAESGAGDETIKTFPAMSPSACRSTIPTSELGTHLAQWRLKLGAEMLQSTEDSVAEVAAVVGYGSQKRHSTARSNESSIVLQRHSVASVRPRPRRRADDRVDGVQTVPASLHPASLSDSENRSGWCSRVLAYTQNLWTSRGGLCPDKTLGEPGRQALGKYDGYFHSAFGVDSRAS